MREELKKLLMLAFEVRAAAVALRFSLAADADAWASLGRVMGATQATIDVLLDAYAEASRQEKDTSPDLGVVS